MVAENPLLAGKWSIKKFRATVINDIWPEVTFFTLVAVMVQLVTVMTDVDLAIQTGLLTVLGTVLGLVISFRTSSAYERYQEGRKLWTSIAIASRNLGQFLWIHVPVDRPAGAAPANESEQDKNDRLRAARLKAVIEKKSMINLIQAFSVSVKHFLRGEAGIYYEDLYPLISFLPRYSVHPPSQPTSSDTLPMWHGHDELVQSARSSPSSSPASSLSSKKHKLRKDSFDPEKALPQVHSEVPLKLARNPPQTTLYDYLPILLIFKPIFSGTARVYRSLTGKRRNRDGDEESATGTRGLTGRKRLPPVVDSNIPLEITLFLSSYLQWLLARPGTMLQPSIASGVVGNISALQDAVSNLERVRNTPIPFAYQAHLRMSLWIYLFFLPFQLQATMKWTSIPATCFAAFLLVGFLEIGQEIENPFGYDENDLDMDAFCFTIQRELHEICAHPSPDPYWYIFGVYNQPFAPADQRSAEEMALDLDHAYHRQDTGMDHIRRTLLQNWRKVEEVTRKAY